MHVCVLYVCMYVCIRYGGLARHWEVVGMYLYICMYMYTTAGCLLQFSQADIMVCMFAFMGVGLSLVGFAECNLNYPC